MSERLSESSAHARLANMSLQQPTHSVDFWFEPCDFTESPVQEWTRQAVAAIASARQAMLDAGPSHFVQILVGSVNGYPRFLDTKGWPTVEGISFRGALPEQVDRALRALGTSRQLAVTNDDSVAAITLAPWGFLVDGTLLLQRSYGRANEREWTYLLAAPVLCVRDELELPDVPAPEERTIRQYLSTRTA